MFSGREIRLFILIRVIRVITVITVIRVVRVGRGIMNLLDFGTLSVG